MADALSKADFDRFRRTGLSAGWPLDCGPARVPGVVLAWLANPVVDEDFGSKILDAMSRSGVSLLG